MIRFSRAAAYTALLSVLVLLPPSRAEAQKMPPPQDSLGAVLDEATRQRWQVRAELRHGQALTGRLRYRGGGLRESPSHLPRHRVLDLDRDGGGLGVHDAGDRAMVRLG